MTKQAIMITALCTAAIWAYEMNGFPQDWQIILSCLPVRILAYATTAWCSKSEIKWFYYFGKFHVNTVSSFKIKVTASQFNKASIMWIYNGSIYCEEARAALVANCFVKTCYVYISLS